MKNHVIMFTSGEEKREASAKQLAAIYKAVGEAAGTVPTPLMQTASRNAIALSVAVDADATVLLSAIKTRLPGHLFQFGKSHGTADCILVVEVGASIDATLDVARAAFGLSRR